jgi:serine/threonine-protein kinase
MGTSDTDLPAGYRFGNYVILERIGRGGMASVYRAEHRALSKQVAIKIVDHALHDKTAAHRQFLREGRAAAAVKHPNVVDITDVGICDGVPFLVMEFLEGWDLETHLRERGPLSDGELVRLALPIIAGLAVAHDAGVIHRDLKPSNIFLAKGADGDQVPKVLDFGISKVISDAQDLSATPYGTVMGTPLYLPPEALAGAQNFSTASDQYSLGVVLYECAVGRPPHRQESLVGLLQSIGSGKFEAPSRLRPDISALVERAILRAMHSDPRLRFAHVRDLGRALWEVASPRTQVLWGRSFGGDAAVAASSMRTAAGPSPGGSFSPGASIASSHPAHASTRKLFATELTVPLNSRSKLFWGAGAALGVVAAGTLTLLLRQAAVPRQEPPMSTLQQPPVELNAALRPAVPVVAVPVVAAPVGVSPAAPAAVPPLSEAAPAQSPPLTVDRAALGAVPGASSPHVAVEASSSPAESEPKEPRRRSRDSAAPAVRGRATAPFAARRDVDSARAVERGASEQASSRRASPQPAPAAPVDDEAPARPPSGASVGANQSPILD